MTPRVIKEADVLAAAGYSVRVVFAQNGTLEKREHDAALLVGRNWRWSAIPWGAQGAREAALRWWSALRMRAFQRVPRIAWRLGRFAEMGEGRMFPELAKAASRERADLFIGHYPTGLAAAGVAAAQWRAFLTFDAEDFHTGEGHHDAQEARIDFIQRRYLSRCAYATASSAGIAEALCAAYPTIDARAVHNVFSWSDRDELDDRTIDRQGDRLSLYWFSQTIGLDRGLQDAIRAAGLLGGARVQIHLRGNLSQEVRDQLFVLARECGVASDLFIHAQVPPGKLLSRAAEHDIGLALEQGQTLNRTICATNKLFLYMLAGLAIAATRVSGQERILSDTADVGILYTPGNYRELAQHLERWRTNPAALAMAKRAALDAARGRWNWEAEAETLVAQVDSLFELSTCRSSAVTNVSEELSAT